MKITISKENMNFFECFSSDTRISILELLSEKPHNIGELAEKLEVSSAVITKHISMLENAGIITSQNVPGKRGVQKICMLKEYEFWLSFNKPGNAEDNNHISIPVGQYKKCEVMPSCGMSSIESIIGLADDPRYFMSPDRENASMLWFKSGYVEYCIPGTTINFKYIRMLEVTFEMNLLGDNALTSQEGTGVEFSLNGVSLGSLPYLETQKEDGELLNPIGWWKGLKHGVLQTLRIGWDRTTLNGHPFSDVKIDQIALSTGADLCFRISSSTDMQEPSGVILFGKGLGKFDVNIDFHILFDA